MRARRRRRLAPPDHSIVVAEEGCWEKSKLQNLLERKLGPTAGCGTDVSDGVGATLGVNGIGGLDAPSPRSPGWPLGALLELYIVIVIRGGRAVQGPRWANRVDDAGQSPRRGGTLGMGCWRTTFRLDAGLNGVRAGQLALHEYTATWVVLGTMLSVVAVGSLSSSAPRPSVHRGNYRPEAWSLTRKRGVGMLVVAPEMMQRVDQPHRFASDVRSMIHPIPPHQSRQSIWSSADGLLHLSPPVSPWSSESLSIRQQQLIARPSLHAST